MNRICVATSKARAYYALVSRLRRAELPFSSVLPGSDCRDCELVLTTADEAEQFGVAALALEDLDENPGIFKGQVMSRLNCLLYTSPSPRDLSTSRMPSSA